MNYETSSEAARISKRKKGSGLRKFKSILIVSLFATGFPAGAQIFSIGIRGGVPLTNGYSGTPSAAASIGVSLMSAQASVPSVSSSPWVIGPTVELHLPFGLGVQADALYRNYSVGGTVSQWEFPILGSYHFRGAAMLKPFIDAGPSFDHVTVPGLIGSSKGAAGFAVGGGIEAKFLFLRIEPEIRYTHWGGANFNAFNVTSNQNEVEFLVGLTF
jgi:opacity protein-like surface antigen